MSLPLLLFWGVVGWCGTPWPRPWPFPLPPPPEPWWLIRQVIGVVGAIVGGWLFTQTWPITSGELQSLSVVASGAGALAGAIIASDIVSLVRRGSQQMAAET
jgi:uncharacterized membrane protein YeaQ/YmgE (transglycosylase-associated protein family)